MVSGISLANKCLLLFGAAVLLIVFGALSVPWTRASRMVREAQVVSARQIADAWEAGELVIGHLPKPDPAGGGKEDGHAEGDEAGRTVEAGLRVRVVPASQVKRDDENRDRFVTAAWRAFSEDDEVTEYFVNAEINDRPHARYARPLRAAQLPATNDPDLQALIELEPEADADDIRALLVIDRDSSFAQGQLLVNRVYLIAAGLLAGLLAELVFYFILTKLILSPVRELRRTTERAQTGDFSVRSQIKTGDEFEQLSDAFNIMLERVERSQAQLQTMYQTMELKIGELSEANIGLFESNRLKGEFLANVSHELRTPLNSIIGFAELLQEMAQGDASADPKRLRYISNILTSGRRLLDMINELLQMAKIEAGRIELSIESTSLVDLVEGLATIMRPQAEAQQLELRTQLAQNLPTVETDPGKLQQILYNFLSNAIKFTPGGGVITITADRLTRQDKKPGVRLGVSDTGPGIPYDMQDMIFEKFRQLDASHTREHAGTGLGLAICRELADMLGATVSLVSEPGRGATFYVDLPVVHQPQQAQPLMA
jgi:signal transduction histidine kinase